MINLLPDEAKRDIRAARMNVVLLRYNLLTLVAAVVMVGFCLVFYFILHSNQSSAVDTSHDNSIKAASYEDTRKKADEYRKNLSIASQIIDNGVSYTNLVFAITKLIPDGVILNGLNLTTATIGQQISFTAQAVSYDAAAELKSNFQGEVDSKEKPLFTNVYFQSLSNNAGGESSSSGNPYPITVTISAKLNKAALQ